MRAAPATGVGALLLGVLFALGGCAVGPDFKRPQVSVAPSWSAKNDPRVAAQAAVDAQWWKSFGDPVLDHLVELAVQQNLPLQVSALRILEARAQLGVATGEQWPQLQVVSGSADAVGLSRSSFNVVNLDRNFIQYQIGFDAAWELDFWGKYRRGVEAQADNLFASVFDYDAALVSLTAEVARTYVLIRTDQVLIQKAQENVRVQEDGLKIAQSRFKNGATSELDPTQAETLLESTRATIPTLEIELQQARNALGTLIGQPTGTVDSLLAGPEAIPKAPAKVAVSVPAELLRRRPDIRSAELFAAAQCARIGVAKAELYPSFSLFGSIGLSANDAGGNARNLFATDSIFYSVGPRISWPFFNYGRIKNQVRVEDARFQQSLVSYRDTVLKAAQEVEDALTGFLKTQEAVDFEQRSVTSAQRSVEIAVVQYREGATDYQRVLDAQRSLLQQETSLVQSSSSVITNLIALYKALGGGWELRQGGPTIPEKMRQQMSERTDWGGMLAEPRPPETTTVQAPEKR